MQCSVIVHVKEPPHINVSIVSDETMHTTIANYQRKDAHTTLSCTWNGSIRVMSFGWMDGRKAKETDCKFFPAIDTNNLIFFCFKWMYSQACTALGAVGNVH